MEEAKWKPQSLSKPPSMSQSASRTAIVALPAGAAMFGWKVLLGLKGSVAWAAGISAFSSASAYYWTMIESDIRKGTPFSESFGFVKYTGGVVFTPLATIALIPVSATVRRLLGRSTLFAYSDIIEATLSHAGFALFTIPTSLVISPLLYWPTKYALRATLSEAEP